MDPLVCQLVPVDVVRPLRHSVLRTGRPFSTCIWDGDDLPDTRHFAACSGDEVVGIATLLHRPHAAAPGAGAWQLRGMATDPQHQGRGIGAALLAFLLDHCHRRDGGTVVWCNARVGASGFYRRHGFEIVGDEFVIPEIGPHYVMRRRLASDA
ncbi:MAG TPA: GNAT family N-acetyltransferase [Phycisphaerae bacterium]|nr:GNAT family N-acetyltransferase [Phycisphaerae bacterium]